MSQSNKYDLRVFYEKLPFDSPFLVNIRFFPWDFCVLKIYHVRLYIVEKMRFGTTPRQCGIRSKSMQLLQKTCLSYISEALAVYAGMCLRTYVLARVHRPRATLVI